MNVTTTTLGFQKLAGFFYSGLGATYTTTVTPGTGVIENFNVLKRPVSSVTSSIIGNGGASGTVIYTENSDIEFELEVWGNVVTVGTFTISSSSTGTGQGSMLASYATDSNGNVTGLVGGDGGVIKLKQANTLAVVGDSITSSWRNISSGVSAVNERVSKGYLSWALGLSGERLTVISDQSIGGSRLTSAGSGSDINLTQLPLAIASGASHLLIQGGVNDIIGGVSLSTIKTAYLSIISKAIGAGMNVWILTIPTLNSAHGSYSVAYQGIIFALNDWLRQQVATQYAKQGVVVVDTASKTIDPVSATGSYITNGSYDNLHPRNLGAYRMGKELARMWSLFIPQSVTTLSSNADNYGYSANSSNILDNGLFVNGAAPATGFTRSLTGTAGVSSETLVSRADGYGNDLTEVCTFAANNDSVRVTTTSAHTRVSDGDKLYAECEISVSGMTNCRCVRLNLVAQGATTNTTATTMQLDSTNDLALTEDYTMLYRTNVIEVDTAILGALSNVSSQVTVFGSGAGGATVKIGRWSIRKVTATE